MLIKYFARKFFFNNKCFYFQNHIANTGEQSSSKNETKCTTRSFLSLLVVRLKLCQFSPQLLDLVVFGGQHLFEVLVGTCLAEFLFQLLQKR